MGLIESLCHGQAIGLPVLICLPRDHDLLGLAIVLDLLAAAPRIAAWASGLVMLADAAPLGDLADRLAGFAGRIAGWGRGAAPSQRRASGRAP